MTAGLPRPLICLVTDRRRVVPVGIDSLVRLIQYAARVGVGLVQVREPGLDDRALASLVETELSPV